MELFNLPNNWDEVYTEQFISLRNIPTDIPVFTRQIEILGILTDILPDDDIWDDMDINDLTRYIVSLKWLKQEPTTNPSKKIDEYTLLDINKITFGEFIDLEHFFTDYYNNLPLICSILYRKTKLDEWQNIQYEKYNYDIYTRQSFFLDQPITKVYGVLKYYLDFKNSIHNNYQSLFEPIIEEDDDYSEEDITDPEELKEIEEEKKHKKWAWENILYKLSEGDITKYDAILDKPVIFIFNQMGFLKEMKI